jgi:hypothetical protein
VEEEIAKAKPGDYCGDSIPDSKYLVLTPSPPLEGKITMTTNIYTIPSKQPSKQPSLWTAVLPLLLPLLFRSVLDSRLRRWSPRHAPAHCRSERKTSSQHREHTPSSEHIHVPRR